MLGAIYIGLSGMNAYTKGLQTISDNVANLNSLGYKSTTVSFSDIYNQGGEGLGYAGQDQPSGGGVRYSTTGTDYTEGNLRQSDGDLDLALQGGGFLVLQTDGKTQYIRTGQFVVDGDGFISLQGTKSHLSVLDANNQAVAASIDAKRTNAPAATTTVKFSDNLSASATTASVSNVTVYDSNGGSHTWTVNFAPVGTTSPGEWNVTVVDSTGATVGTSALKFLGSTVDPTTQTLTFTSTPAGADAMSVVFDFSKGVTSFDSGPSSTIRAASVDGNATGALTGVTVDANGAIQLAYSNNKTDKLGSIAIADFTDPQQLQRVGNSMFENQKGAKVRLFASGSPGVGTIMAHELEESNVNLSEEFGDLILIQRGFQASSEVVSTSNDMIQELFGIRGRG